MMFALRSHASQGKSQALTKNRESNTVRFAALLSFCSGVQCRLCFCPYGSVMCSVIVSVCLCIKFRKTKQKVVALVATAFKAMLSVAKTSVGLSRRKLYTGNINYLFWNIVVHSSPKHKKSALQ